jgi:uncharacterized protein (DUF433 family)
MIDWSRCSEVESVPGRCSGAWVVKNSGVLVDGILDNFEAAQTPPAIARMFSPAVPTARRVLQFALSAELQAMPRRQQFPARRRGDAYRIDKLAHQLIEIDRALRRSRGPAPSG